VHGGHWPVVVVCLCGGDSVCTVDTGQLLSVCLYVVERFYVHGGHWSVVVCVVALLRFMHILAFAVTTYVNGRALIGIYTSL